MMKKKVERILTCHSPRVIKNIYSGEYINVSCGECSACRLKKSARLTQLCKFESQTHKYCYFVTLTYSDLNIPRIEPVYDYDHDKVELYSEDCLVYTYKISDYEKLKEKCGHEKIPYLRKKDLQNFIKRFRFHLDSKKAGLKIRYFGAGEYGPDHFRPHYHLLIWCDSHDIRSVFHSCLYKAWTFGIVDYSLSRGDCASYVSGYINANGRLPKVYKTKELRPFASHSFYLGQKLFRYTRKELLENDPREIISRGYLIDAQYIDIRLPSSFISYLLPRCKGFACKDHEQLTRSYTLYRWFKKFFREEKVSVLSRYVVDFYLHDAHKWYPATQLYEPLRTMYDEINMTFNLKDLSYVDGSLTNFEEYKEKLYNNIYHILSVSAVYERHIYPIYWSDHIAITKLSEFYKRIEYLNLINQLESEESFFEDGLKNIDYIKYFYVNTYDIDDWKHTDLYEQNYLYYELKAEAAIKHKKQNDLNRIFEQI